MRILRAILRESFIQSFYRTPCTTNPTPTHIRLSFKSFCSQAQNNSETEAQNPPECLSWRIEKLPKSESVGFAFRSWMGDGLSIHRGEVFHIINRLRKLNKNKRALEVTIPFFLSGFLSLSVVYVKFAILREQNIVNLASIMVPTSLFFSFKHFKYILYGSRAGANCSEPNNPSSLELLTSIFQFFFILVVVEHKN